MADALGIRDITSSSTTGSPLSLDFDNDTFDQNFAVTNLMGRDAGAVLVRGDAGDAWTYVRPHQTVAVRVTATSTLDIAIQAPYYRSMATYNTNGDLVTPSEVPHRILISAGEMS